MSIISMSLQPIAHQEKWGPLRTGLNLYFAAQKLHLRLAMRLAALVLLNVPPFQSTSKLVNASPPTSYLNVPDADAIHGTGVNIMKDML